MCTLTHLFSSRYVSTEQGLRKPQLTFGESRFFVYVFSYTDRKYYSAQNHETNRQIRNYLVMLAANCDVTNSIPESFVAVYEYCSVHLTPSRTS